MASPDFSVSGTYSSITSETEIGVSSFPFLLIDRQTKIKEIKIKKISSRFIFS